MKKAAALILTVSILLSCWGCRGSNMPQNGDLGQGSDSAAYKISLAFCDNDYLNPYTCVTNVNSMLASLLYEPLVGIDGNYNRINALAESVAYDDGYLFVKIKSNVKFSDGSPFSSGDVKYSFDLAKKEGGNYCSDLSSITACEVIDSLNLKFRLAKKDVYAANLLTFPIIKAESDKLESSDNVLYDPIGTGRYVRKEFALFANENYRTADTLLKNITLINTPDSEALEHNISAGRISVYYSDLANGDIPRMVGKNRRVATTNLVYIGINEDYYSIDSDIRQVISGIIDREELCETALTNYAKPAAGLYPAHWPDAEGIQTILPTADIDNMLAKLATMGYNAKDKDGYYCNEKGKIISLDILVNKENRNKMALAQLISAQLEECGIKAVVTPKSYDDYIKSLRNGDFQLYIGEVRFKNNMDVSQLLVHGGSAAFGVNQSQGVAEDEGQLFAGTTQDKIKEFYSGDALFSDILIHFMSELPVIPICYRLGWLGYDANLPDNILNPWLTNVYYGIWKLG